MTGSEIYLKFKAFLEDRVSAGISRITKIVSGTTKAAGKLCGALSQMASSVGSQCGKMITSIGEVVGSIQQLGAIGGIIAGANIAISMWADRAKKAVEDFTDSVGRMAQRVKARYEEVNQQRLDRLSESLKQATTLAERSARAFDTMAAAWMKVNAARANTGAAEMDSQIAALERQKSEAMSVATGSDRSIVGSGFDIQIAEKRVEAVRKAGEERIALATKDLDDANRREVDAVNRVDASRRALAEAEKELAITKEHDAKQVSVYAQRVEAAEAALATAYNDQVSKTAAREAAQEALRQAKINAGAANDRAVKGVVDAKTARNDLVAAQKAAQQDELARKQKEKDFEDAKKASEEKKRMEERRKQAMQAEVDALDKAARQARERSESWEQNARKVRGRNFNDVERERRDNDRGGPTKFERQNAANERKAERLETDLRRGLHLSEKESQWLKRFKDWKDAQDPKNNKAAQEAARLEAKRDKTRQDMLVALQKVNANLEKSLNVN